MSPDEAHSALIERSAAAAGVTPDTEMVELQEPPEVMARRMLQGLLEHEEIEEVLPKIWGGANASLVTLSMATPDSAQHAMAGIVMQMMTYGILLGKGRS